MSVCAIELLALVLLNVLTWSRSAKLAPLSQTPLWGSIAALGSSARPSSAHALTDQFPMGDRSSRTSVQPLVLVCWGTVVTTSSRAWDGYDVRLVPS